jgi:hypothetical protein
LDVDCLREENMYELCKTCGDENGPVCKKCLKARAERYFTRGLFMGCGFIAAGVVTLFVAWTAYLLEVERATKVGGFGFMVCVFGAVVLFCNWVLYEVLSEG